MTLPRHEFTKSWEWKSRIDAGDVSPKTVVQEYLSRIEKDSTNSFISVDAEGALRAAETYDPAAGKAKALAGTPVALKDILITKGLKTTAGSKILANYIPPYSGTVVKKVKEAGLINLGKLNMDEFAMGSSGENSAFGRTKLPQDESRVPGGSSSGSAAAVAANLSPISLGTDTGGSVRQPASFCGVVGMKPTYGRVSRYGVVAFASSLDQIGPFALDSMDCALAMEAISGFDELDSTSAQVRVPAYADAVRFIRDDAAHRAKFGKNLRVGIPKQYFTDGLDGEVRSSVENSIELLKSNGATVVEVDLPHSDYALAVYYVVAVSEASANLARYDGVRFGLREMPNGDKTTLDDMYSASRGAGFGEEVKRRILLGTFTLSAGYYDAYFKKACQVRNLISQDFHKAFQECDVIVGPTTPTPAFVSGDKTDPLQMYLNDIYTVPVNLAGISGLSMPCGESKSGLPIGLQLIGPAFSEQLLLETCASLECLLDAKG